MRTISPLKARWSTSPTLGGSVELTKREDELPSHFWSYAKHADHEMRMVNLTLPSAYSNPGSIDAWRHRRMHETLLPILREAPGSSWLTIGDGNFGSDAHFLIQHGVQAVASSISESTLAPAKKQAFIKDFQVENAEALTPADNTFDFVLCKESYHHFPRPPIAFYEMLRVSKIAVVLIEPCDGPRRILDCLKILIKKVMRRNENDQFETSGNFIYRANEEEVRKMMTALNHPCVAYRPFNDFFHAKISDGMYGRDMVKTLVTLLGVGVQNLLGFLHLMNHGLGTIVAFKKEPSTSLRRRLEQAGYRVSILPRNPYV